MKTSFFSFILYFAVLCKNHLYFNKIYIFCQILSIFKFRIGSTAGKPPPPYQNRCPLIGPKCIYFLEHFCYYFSSNFCVLNITNTD
jgi:hypothetical protein